jgi:hypothetical protein
VNWRSGIRPVQILSVQNSGGEYVINPPPETIMMPDAKLFRARTSEQVLRFKEILY